MAEQSSDIATSNPLDDEFAKFVRSTMERLHIPGMSIAVVHKDNVYSEGYGMAELPDTPATPETLYFAASTTKSFCAASLALLMDDKKVGFDWTTPISTLLRDDFVVQDEYITNHATLEDAACHRTNIPRHDESYFVIDTLRDIVRRLRDLPLIKLPFRTKFEYANTTWATLSHIVETLSGKSTEEFLQERIWGPLGMDHTTFGTVPEDKKDRKKGMNFARGYWWDEKTQKHYEEPYMDLNNIAGAGANISTALDYAKYLKMMINKTGPLSEKAHADLRRPRSIVDESWVNPSVFPGQSVYALGWMVQDYRNVQVITHGGDIYGFNTQMLYVPSLSFGTVIFANSNPNGMLADKVLLYYLLDKLLGIPAAERFDTVKWGEADMAKQEDEKSEIRNKLYPDIASSVSQTLSASAYEGTYKSPGYGTYTFSPSTLSPVIPGATPDKPVLRAKSIGKTWPHDIELEHISGEHFIAWLVTRRGTADAGGGVDTFNRGVKAEFRVGPDGKVVELGVAMETALGDEKIWFRREG